MCVAAAILAGQPPGGAAPPAGGLTSPGQAPAAGLDPDLPYQAQRSCPVTYDVEMVLAVTAPAGTKKLRVWLPLPQTDAAQEVREGELVTFPENQKAAVAREPLFGNVFAYWEFADPQGAQVIRHRFTVKTWELRWRIDPARVQTVSRWPDGFGKYLRSEQTVVVDDRFARLGARIVPRRQGPVQDLAAVLGWAADHMTYDHSRASLKASSVHALETGAGHCSDYHGLCAAVGRALNYPTRITYGINPFPKASPSHCKLEVFLPPYGWVSFDVSETQRLVAAVRAEPGLSPAEKDRLCAAARARLGGGFRDNTWFLQTRGSDYDLVPPASRRVPVVRTLYAEADGTPLPDPDPSDHGQRAFAWMTAHKYTPDKPVTYPFQDWRTLLEGPQ
jgi:transglutaminase-like putative cysteine protease